MKKYAAFLFIILIATAFFPAENIQELVDKWNAYYKKYPQVRVHLEFNQEKYSPGDTAFYKAYFLTEDYKPMSEKQILTLQLKDKEGNNVHVQNFRVTEGEGYNQVVLSDKIKPGEYTIVAYSEWMKNFGAATYFRRPMLVVGRTAVAVEKMPVDSLWIYPEGGKLVEGVANHIVIKSGRPGAGKIFNQSGNVSAEFTITRAGIGSATLTPEVGQTYYAEQSGINGRFLLPAAIEDGCALKLNSIGRNQGELLISTASNSLGKQELSVVVTSKGKVMYFTPVQMEGSTVSVNIPTLAPGLNQVYVFDRRDNLLGERIYYAPVSNLSATIQVAEDELKPRGAIEFEASVTDVDGRPLSGNFSVTALNASLFSEVSEPSFELKMNLFNDMPELARSFRSSGLSEEEWMQSVNDQLVTQRWNRISWDEINNGRKGKEDYAFKYSLNLKGQAYFDGTGEAVPDSTLIMIYLQKGMVGYETYTDKAGAFSFPFLYDFTGNDRVFYMMEFRKRVKQDDYKMKPELMISDEASAGGTQLEVPDRYGEYVFRKRLIDKSFSFFNAPEKKIDARIINPNTEFEDELGGVDVNMKVDEYVVFPTMSDLIHEVISGLQVRNINGKPGVRVVFIRNTYTVIPKGDPLYIIDGVLTRNTEYFLSLNPENVLTIKLINEEGKLARFGGMGKNGIVLVQTKRSVANEVAERSTVFSISGLSDPLEFKSPQYTTPSQSRVPDLRSTLYWNPTVAVGINGKARVKFFASDDAGPILLKVEGLTSDGRPFSAEKTILVQAPEIKN